MTPTKIRTLRKSIGLSADAFAERIGLDGENRQLTVYRWEKGIRKPSGPAIKLMEMLKAEIQK